MSNYILEFNEIDKSKITMVGGKAANLGELYKIEGIHVPKGFCLTTKAYDEIIGTDKIFDSLITQLSLLKSENLKSITEISAKLRKAFEDIVIPKVISKEIIEYLEQFGSEDAYAIRSSATAEDLSSSSFAGQHDTFLNIVGKESILKHVKKCLASLFTDRAIIYRIKNRFDHKEVSLSVVVQKMIIPEAAGTMFTADPVSSNRKILSIEANFGLGEALVSGLVNADNYQVCNSQIVSKSISQKEIAVVALKQSGTDTQVVEQSQRSTQTLNDEDILKLAQVGKQLEAHFGTPQDIEWCRHNNIFYILQSRPITTLYPVPEANDEDKHVFISVGHQQMMTDPMKPLGLSIWQLISSRPMYKAGGRLFVDVAKQLMSASNRESLLNVMGQHDPLIKDALTTIIDREFIQPLPEGEKHPISHGKTISAANSNSSTEDDPNMVLDLIMRSQISIESLKNNIQGKSGPVLFEFILEDIQQFKETLADPKNMSALMTIFNTSLWLNERIKEWLDEQNVADILSQSAPNNVTSEMGLALLDVADIIRPYPEVIDYINHLKDKHFLKKLSKLKGGQESCHAIISFLNKYGMRCAGEIDITTARWSENPLPLIPMITSNINNFDANAGKRNFEQGEQRALKKEKDLLSKLRRLPDGESRAKETKKKIDILRAFVGYREYPKCSIINRLFIYKQALLKEIKKLVKTKLIQEEEDAYYLTFEELREAVLKNELDCQLINERKNEHKQYEKLMPPRVITSDGEIVTGKYNRENLPEKLITGLPVSSYVVEGRARVILNIEDADLEKNDILITKFTDPGWTPLFVSIKGLVTEVGGMMTHGAVIAREYGVSAVVGVENATKLIKDGQKIRVNGTEGYIEILEDSLQ